MGEFGDPVWLTDGEQRAWRTVLTLRGNLMAELGRRLFRESGLSMSDYDVLVPLCEAPHGVLAVRTLLGTLDWEASRLSHQLTRMQGRGLLTRRASAKDGRRSEVHVTDAGQAALRAAAPGHVAAVRELFIDRLDGGQVQTLADIGVVVAERDAEAPADWSGPDTRAGAEHP